MALAQEGHCRPGEVFVTEVFVTVEYAVVHNVAR